MTRYELRVEALNIMYQIYLGTLKRSEAIQMEHIEKDTSLLNDLICETLTKEDELKIIIEKFLVRSWTFDRLNYLEQSILVLGTCELVAFEDIPPIVTINEWVEIGKNYCGMEAMRLINGVLNNIKNELKGIAT